MLLGKHRCRHQQRRLLPVENALHHGAQRDLRLAVAHVAAEQAVHRRFALHIRFDLLDGAELIVRFLKVERILKLALPRRIRRKGEAGTALPLGIERDKSLGKVLRRRFRLRLGTAPVGAAEPGKPRGALAVFVRAAADVFRHQIKLRRRHVQRVAAGIAELDVVLFHTVHTQALDAGEASDAVVDVHHQVAGRQVGVGLELLAARILFLPHRPFFAGDCRGELPLGQDRKLQLRPLAAGGKRAETDDDLAGAGQRLILKVRTRGDSALVQKARHVFAARFVAAQHQDAAAETQILFHIRRRGLKASAVGGELAHVERQQRPRRGKIARGGEAVEHDERILAELLRELLGRN